MARKITIYNLRPVPVRWAGHIFPGREETTVELDEPWESRLRHQRSLRFVKAEDSSTGGPAWGTTIKSAMEYVGDDATRAAEVLNAEHSKGDKARKSLVESLQAVIDAAAADGAGDAATADGDNGDNGADGADGGDDDADSDNADGESAGDGGDDDADSDNADGESAGDGEKED